MLNQLALEIGNIVGSQKEFGTACNSNSDNMEIEELKPLLSLSTSELAIYLAGEPVPIDWTVVDRESMVILQP